MKFKASDAEKPRDRRHAHSLGALALALLLGATPPAWAVKFAQEPAIQSKPLSPAESLKLLRVEEGLRVELVAAEPLVDDPAEIAFDELGRMFVAEICSYNRIGALPRSRIRILRDEDGDGTFDYATIFADDLEFAQGLLPTHGGLIVTTSSSVLFLQDTDGDGRSDRRETLFRCKPAPNIDGQISSPRRGIDNWIYFNRGLLKQELSLPPNPDRIIPMATNFRYHQGTRRLEPTSGTGQFGKAFDDWGREFFSSNRNPAKLAVLPAAYLERNAYAFLTQGEEDVLPAEGAAKLYPLRNFRTTADAHAGTFTAACGTGVYRGDMLGQKFAGSVFVCDPTGALVTRWILQPSGAAFRGRRAHEGKEFLASGDEWFRPVNVTTGPDGALYVVDMYRRFIDGARFFRDDYVAANDMGAGTGMGRIYRIVPKTGAPRPARIPADAFGRVAVLEHPNGWHRDTAQRLLVEAGDRTVAPAVEEILAKSTRPLGRLHALWTLEGLSSLRASHVERALADPSPGVVENALWLAPRFVGQEESIRVAVIRLAQTSEARLRLAAHLALGDIHTPEAHEVRLAGAVRDADDAWLRRALLSSTATQKGTFLAGLLEKPAFTKRGTGGRIEIVKSLALVLGAQAQAGELRPALASLNRALDEGDTWWKVAVVSGIAEGLRRQTGKSLPKTVSELVGHPPPELMDVVAGISKAAERAAGILRDPARPVIERVAALPMLLHLPRNEALPLFGPLLDSREPLEIQRAAMSTLTQLDRSTVNPILYANLATMGSAARSEALQFLQRDSLEFLQKIKTGVVNPALVDAEGRWTVLNSRLPEVRSLGEEIFGRAENDREAVAQRYAAAITKHAGLAGRGRELFRQNCATCHRFRGEGNSFGPDITDVRIKTPEMLLSDILAPNNAVDPQWEAYSIQLRDGRTLAGLLAAETRDTIVVKSSAGSETIPRQNLATCTPLGISLMPQGFEASISESAMSDLVAYLRSEPPGAK